MSKKVVIVVVVIIHLRHTFLNCKCRMMRNSESNDDGYETYACDSHGVLILNIVLIKKEGGDEEIMYMC